jgi:branched-chain amino acid transport system substrate-binding protein
MNNGPYTGLAGAMLFARQTLRARTLCVTLFNLPGMMDGYRRAMDRLADQDQYSAPELRTLRPGQDPVPVIRDLVERRCDVAIYTGPESAVLDWMAAAAAQRVKGITWVFLTSAYTATVAKALAASTQPVYAMSEFEPWNSSSMSLADWRQLMRKADLPLSSLSQGGYMSAQILVRALRRISGPISRTSVTQALRSLPIQQHGLVGMPFLIGNRAAHNPNRATMPMRLQDGTWRIAASQWITVPEVMAPSP